METVVTKFGNYVYYGSVLELLLSPLVRYFFRERLLSPLVRYFFGERLLSPLVRYFFRERLLSPTFRETPLSEPTQ